MLTIKIEGLKETQKKYRRISGRVDHAAFRAINEAVDQGRTLSSKVVRSQVNLKAKYVKDRIVPRKANAGNLVGTLTARSRPTLLTRFESKQLTRGRKTAKGDPARGIKPGRRQAGVSYRIKSAQRGGGREKNKKFFMIRLKKGGEKNAGAMGVAVRTGRGVNAYKVFLGPSVDQVLRGAINQGDIYPGINKVLGKEFDRQMRRELKRARINVA